MQIKDIVYEDFLQYKKPSMFIICPRCTFKCDKESGTQICQNWKLAQSKNIEVDDRIIIEKYLNNPITKSIVFGGLEPFETFDELYEFLVLLRKLYHNYDDVVIYTGFNREEIEDEIESLQKFSNIIIKFGRYLPNQSSHFDEVLGINLASSNQYAERIC